MSVRPRLGAALVGAALCATLAGATPSSAAPSSGGETVASPSGDPKEPDGVAPETVVTATRVEEDPTTLPQTVTVATQAEIQRRMPSQPSDALLDEPGVWVQQTGASGGAPIIRGLIGNKVLYLVDGIRINNGRLFGGPNGFFNQVDVDSVDRIEVLRGPGAVQYGSDAMGGVIHLRTRGGPRFADQLQAGGLLRARYRTVDEALAGHLELRAENPFLSVYVGGTAFANQDFTGGRGVGTVVNTSRRSRAGMAKVHLKIAEGHVLTAAFLQNDRFDIERHDQSRRNPSGAPRFFDPQDTRRLTYLRDRIETDLPLLAKIEPYVYFQEAVRKSNFTAESSTEIRIDRRENRERMWGGGIQATSNLPGNASLTYGLDVRYETFHDRSMRTTTPTSSPPTTQRRGARSPDGTYDSIAGFLMASWWPAEVLRLQAGLRFESIHLNASPSPLDTSAGFSVDDLDVNDRWNAFTWSFGTVWWMTDALSFAASAATGFRAPTYSDTLSRGPFTFGVNAPSTSLDPETSFSYELGPRFSGFGLNASVTWYQTFLQDQLTSRATGGFIDLDGNGVQDPGEDEYQKANGGSSRIYGIEARGDWTLPLEGLGPFGARDSFAVFGSVSWTYGQDLGADEPLRFTPPTHGILGLRYRHGEAGKPGFEAQLSARMARFHGRVGSRDARDPARASDPSIRFPSSSNPPLRQDLSVPGFLTLHARIQLALTERASVYLAADNLLNKRYRVAYARQDGPGLSLSLGGEVRF